MERENKHVKKEALQDIDKEKERESNNKTLDFKCSETNLDRKGKETLCL